MGYIEGCCQLCAVSFNIARIRTKGEPKSHSWDYINNSEYWGSPDAACVPAESGSGCEVGVNEEEDEIHIAGPGCCDKHGYSGYRIRVEEMKVSDIGSHFPSTILGFPRKN